MPDMVLYTLKQPVRQQERVGLITIFSQEKAVLIRCHSICEFPVGRVCV